MICSDHNQDVAREVVNLQEQRAHDSLDLTRVVSVAALLGDCIELVEEEQASSCLNEIEQSTEVSRGLSQETPNQRLVANHKEWREELPSQSSSEGRLSIPRRTCQQQPVSGLKIMGPEEIPPVLLLHNLQAGSKSRSRDDQFGQTEFCLNLGKRSLATGLREPLPIRRHRPIIGTRLFQPVSQDVVLSCALLRDECIQGPFEPLVISTAGSFHQINEQVRSGHSS